jgi:acetylornithine deacetylase/succinyl-diaminopimelate desuccinylase-like protein
MSQLQDIRTYIDAHQDRFLAELMDLLRIPSVSADPKYKDDVARTAEALKGRMNELGLLNVQVYPTPGHPIVYGETRQDPSRPTVLVYGHYDVQPPDPVELWTSPPFEPVIKDGKIYARGSCDDKGQMYMHMKAYEILKHLGQEPTNIKFLIEGEEEVGSKNLEDFIRAHSDMLKCDVILISDTSMVANDVPSITTGLRGLAYLEVEVTGPNRDLHSGTYGGAVDNPISVLAEMISSMKDENRHITIPGFYDDVVELSAEERKLMNERPFNQEKYNAALDIAATRGEKGYTVIEQVSIRPTLEINGMWGGYIGEGAKTVLPSKAYAKISMRLVPNQHPDKILKLFTDHFNRIAPSSVKVTVKPHHGGEAAVTSITSPGYRAASAAMEATFGKAPIPTKEGGSIPIVAMFKKVLGADSVLMGFGLDSDAIHSPNENYGVFNYLKGIETIPLFHVNLPGMMK